jgi:hypothetical protein
MSSLPNLSPSISNFEAIERRQRGSGDRMATRRSTQPPLPPTSSIAVVVPKGDLRDSLIAIRDRLALETDDLLWARHKAECRCTCGMADPRALVALTKRLEETLAALAALPEPTREVSPVDALIGGAAATNDELAAKRSARHPGATA